MRRPDHRSDAGHPRPLPCDHTCPRSSTSRPRSSSGRDAVARSDRPARHDGHHRSGNVRTYFMASTQHGACPLPLAAQPPFGNCQQQANPNPQIWTMRALLVAFAQWVRDDVTPPPSAARGSPSTRLWPPEDVRFPPSPPQYGGVPRAAGKFLRITNPLYVLDFGPQYRARTRAASSRSSRRGSARAHIVSSCRRSTWTATTWPDPLHPRPSADWHLHGVESLPGPAVRGRTLSLQGSFIPFARTHAERLASGDPRPSIEERYPTRDAYLDAVRHAADDLVKRRFLLAADAAALIAEAEKEGIRLAPWSPWCAWEAASPCADTACTSSQA